MTAFKEFQGKTLDLAIEEACKYYDVPREKLEIDIVNDAKSGIFGLVGAKKATIMAARANLSLELLDKPAEAKKKETKRELTPTQETEGKTPDKREERPARVERTEVSKNNKQKTHTETQKNVGVVGKATDETSSKVAPPQRPKQDKLTPSLKPKNTEKDSTCATSKIKKHAKVSTLKQPETDAEFDAGDLLAEAHDDEKMEFALNLHSAEVVCDEVCQAITKLITPIVGETACNASAVQGRIRVELDCGETAGILVGREGQTLAAIQYIAARIVGKKLGGAVRLQIDVGNYRERQEERLREMAIFLAEKVKSSKRAQSTRPLTAYQRRIIHLTLEGDELLHTHSKGEGAQKRVIVQLRKPGKGNKYTPETIADNEAEIMGDV